MQPSPVEDRATERKRQHDQLVDHMLSSAVGPRDRILPQIEAHARSMTIPERIAMETERRMRERHRAVLDADYDPCAAR